ncbi:hypothetical protein NFI96_008198, partial [Prochilodus magdalenae]
LEQKFGALGLPRNITVRQEVVLNPCPSHGLCTLGVCLPRQYHYVNESKTWPEAQRYCREHYTDLASIDTAEVGLGLLNLVDVRSSGPTWIGLYDDLSSWRWSLEDDGFYKGKERNYRNWYIQKPVNWHGNSLCARITIYDMTWNEASCFSALPFICYDGSENASERYVVVSEKKNWTEAQSYCREHHTDLVSVRNETENEKLKSALENKYYEFLWIGLYRTRSWSDGSNSSFSNWKPGEPDNAWQNEYCTAVSFNDFGQWTDVNCNRAFPFLCYSGTSTYLYHFVEESKTWTEARRYCRELYTDLATIDNMEEMDMIINTVNGSYSGLAWIGLYDDLDSWRWSLDDDSFYMEGERDYRGWSHEPDNNGGKALCVHMSFSGMWFDIPCKEHYTFVCYDGRAGSENYIWINQGMSWPDAQHYCREHYTDLASVRNWTENQRILKMSGFCTGQSCDPHQYHFINEPMTWAAAQRYCRETYTDLATFDNVQEVNGLLMTVKDTYSGLAWIGLYDDLNSWRWSLDVDGFYKENERNFRNWYIKKPKNWGGDRLCMYFQNWEGVWYDSPCSYKSSFICYDGSVNARQRYVVVYEGMNWTEAQRYCREHHTDLVSVRSETENQKLKSLLQYNYNNFWIGLYRTRSWSDGSNSTFSNWRPGQPDNAGQNEHCTAVSFNNFGQWTDEDCDQAFPFLCYSDWPPRQYHFVNESKTWTEAQSKRYSGIAWIGLYDDLDSWRWSLDDDSFYMEGERDYRGWYREPDNGDGKELCIYMSGTGEWYDGACTHTFRFVCYDVPPPQVPVPAVGVQMKVRAAGNLAEFQIEELLIEQLQQRFGALGLPSNVTVRVKNIQKASP